MGRMPQNAKPLTKAYRVYSTIYLEKVGIGCQGAKKCLFETVSCICVCSVYSPPSLFSCSESGKKKP